jgi:hypothetical protein
MDFYYRKISPKFLKSLEESKSVHGLENIQNYLPIYTNFLNINNKNYNTVGLNSYFEPLSVVLPVPGHNANANDDDDENSCDEYDPHYLDVEMVDTTNPNCNPEVKGVFVKYSPLLDPIRFLSGKYSSIEMSTLMELPTYADPEAITSKRNHATAKIMDVNNSAYVDGFFTYLSSKVMHAHKFVHGLDYYGSFVGHKRRFEVDITDDTDFFSNCSFFNSNLGKLFHMDEYSYNRMSIQTGLGMGKENASERAYKPKITIFGGKNDDALDLIPITFDTIDEPGLGKLFSDTVNVEVVNDVVNTVVNSVVDGIENVYTKAISDSSIHNAKETDDNDNDNDNNNDKRHSDSNSNSNSNSRRSSHDSRTSDTSCRDNVTNTDTDTDTDEECDKCDHHEGTGEHEGEKNEKNDESEADGSEDDSEYDSEDEEEEDDGIYVEIDKFPVNAILMEECEDTLDALMENDEITSPEQWSSILMQIIMTLIAYQKLFGFTHNDLHTNNIMFIETKKEYLYYTYNGKHYRVPTFGKIFKVIDFGRAVYKFKNITMCSDSFHSSGDAATQYNFPPYMNSKKPLLEPNFSFDLCRLACSMFDYFIPMGDIDNIDNERVKQLISNNPIIALIDEWVRDDKGRNVLYKSSGKERYPDFKLYKMIARTVHNHIPAKQLANPLFSKYEVKRSSLSGNAKQQFMNIDDWPEYFS